MKTPLDPKDIHKLYKRNQTTENPILSSSKATALSEMNLPPPKKELKWVTSHTRGRIETFYFHTTFPIESLLRAH